MISSTAIKVLMGLVSVVMVVAGIREGTWNKSTHKPTRHGYFVILLGVILFALGSLEVFVSRSESEEEKLNALVLQAEEFERTRSILDSTIETLNEGFNNLNVVNNRLVDLLSVTIATVKDRFAKSGLSKFSIMIETKETNAHDHTIIFRFDTGFEIWVAGDVVELHTRDSGGYCLIETASTGIPFALRTFDAIYPVGGGMPIDVPNLELRDGKPYILFQSEMIDEKRYDMHLHEPYIDKFYKTDIVRVNMVYIEAHIDNLELKSAKEVHFDRIDNYSKTEAFDLIILNPMGSEKPKITISMPGLGTAIVNPSEFVQLKLKCGEYALAEANFTKEQ